ncbi:MAG: hypothetical protein LBF26_02715 [Puniceicoccales bacterium]|jgi:hypothetical protein|nr:hypothetical protein [Puniceicoccales bacterium]
MCSIFGSRFGGENARDTHQNIINEHAKLELKLDEVFDAWQVEHPDSSWDDFLNDATVKISIGENTDTSRGLVKKIQHHEAIMSATKTGSHWSLATVGVLGGMLFLGAFLAFVFVAMPVLLPLVPAFGCVATFLTASILHTTLCAAGTFLVGLFISAAIHGAIYPYACGPAVLPETKKKPNPSDGEN